MASKANSEPENGFFQQVYDIVAQIPKGQALSYGQIAQMLGRPRAARMVGWAMRRCPEELPWHRVVKADGSIRIDKIADESVSELIIPDKLTYQGATRLVSEISAKACMNLKALTKLDFSEATSLKIIGEQAFAHAPHLRAVVAHADFTDFANL